MATEVLVDQLAELLDRHPRAEGVEVVGWRMDVSDGRSVRAGVKDNKLGGPYQPPSTNAGTGGGIYLRWSDGLVSHGNVDAQTVERFDERLAAWRLAAYEDPWAPEIAEPQPVPTVRTFDPAVDALLHGDASFAFELLTRARDGAARSGVELVDAGVGVRVGERFVASSRGLRLSYPESSCSLWLSGDDLYWRSFQKRRAILSEEADFIIDDVGRTVAALKQPGELASGTMPVLLPTDVLDDFIRTFLGGNLGGSAVVNGQSAYRLDDFKESGQVARSDFDLWVDTTLDLEMAASPCSSEGVPGGRVALIEGGRLVTPTLDLKYAGRAGMAPTPMPRGYPGFLVRLARPLLEEQEAIQEIEHGLLVLSVLGMHTQDYSSGNYSLVAPQARVIKDGKPGGQVKAVLAGNFFDHLKDPDTRFVAFPHELNPGAVIRCAVTVET